MSGLSYDTGALIAAERGDRLLWSLHRAAVQQGMAPTVQLVVLAQAWRGGPQPKLSRLLRGCDVAELNEQAAWAAGTLCAAAATSDIVGAAVVAGAIAGAHVVVTSEPADIAHLTAAAGATLTVHQV